MRRLTQSVDLSVPGDRSIIISGRGQENSCRVKYSPTEETITFTDQCTLPATIFKPSTTIPPRPPRATIDDDVPEAEWSELEDAVRGNEDLEQYGSGDMPAFDDDQLKTTPPRPSQPVLSPDEFDADLDAELAALRAQLVDAPDEKQARDDSVSEANAPKRQRQKQPNRKKPLGGAEPDDPYLPDEGTMKNKWTAINTWLTRKEEPGFIIRQIQQLMRNTPTGQAIDHYEHFCENNRTDCFEHLNNFDSQEQVRLQEKGIDPNIFQVYIDLKRKRQQRTPFKNSD